MHAALMLTRQADLAYYVGALKTLRVCLNLIGTVWFHELTSPAIPISLLRYLEALFTEQGHPAKQSDYTSISKVFPDSTTQIFKLREKLIIV